MAYRLKYKNRLNFYHRRAPHRNAYGTPQTLNKPNLGLENAPTFIANENVDLRARDKIDLLESIRSPRERDFYQDHTYHDAWEERSLQEAQKKQLTDRYAYFDPNFQIKPWLWYPGDIVEVIDGPAAGQRGSIIAVVPYKNQVIVQNINVKDITLPSGDGRPEQIVQREHPINARIVKHVDPSNNQLCELKLLEVKAKNEDGTPKLDEDGNEMTEERRISMLTGTILPMASKTAPGSVETGDPLRDTPYHDAAEVTYDEDKEMAVLVERKLAALEKHFTDDLRKRYFKNRDYANANARQMRRFQADAVQQATAKVLSELDRTAEQLDDWWFEDLAPYMAELEKRDEQRIKLTRKRKAAAERKKSANSQAKQQAAASSADADEEDEEFEEQPEDVAADSTQTDSAKQTGDSASARTQ